MFHQALTSTIMLSLVLAWGCGPLAAQEPPEPVDTDAADMAPTEPSSTADMEGAPPEPAEEVTPAPEASKDDSTSDSDAPHREERGGTTAEKKVPPAAQAGKPAEKEDPAIVAMRRDGPRELFELAGIEASHLRPIRDGWPLSDDELEVMLKLLYRVERLGPLQTSLWTWPKAPLAEMAARPEEFRLQMFHLRGRAEQVIQETPPVEVMQRYDMQHYYACQVELDGSAQPVLVISPKIPARWNLEAQLNESVSVNGLFLKAGENRGDKRQLIFLAARIGWHPEEVRENESPHAVNFGMTELGRLGMDVSLLEDVQNRERISDRDREAFYQMLAAVGHASQAQLVRFTEYNLPAVVEKWQRKLSAAQAQQKEINAALEGAAASAAAQQELKQRAEAVRRRVGVLQRAYADARQQRYSVYPLFNLADEQHGELVLLEGTAKQAIRIEVSNPADPHSNQDILQRFGIDHYYEVAIFTRDSGTNPLIVCVRELPKGFPTGSDLNEPVAIPAFFFKTWAYYTNEGAQSAGDAPPTARQRLAPLLIARSVTWIPREAFGHETNVALYLGAAFVILAAAAWISVWRFTRKDEKFRKTVLVRKYELEAGESLNNAGLETTAGPDFSYLNARLSEDGTKTDERVAESVAPSGSAMPGEASADAGEEPRLPQ